MKLYCADCGHLSSKHEGSAEEEFVASHGGHGLLLCEEIVRTGESADLCGCRFGVGRSSAREPANHWPSERPAIATIPAPGPPLTEVRLMSTEVTTTDPVTGQPDFEHIEIVYAPGSRLVDTKSLKAYWRWWRGRGASMERLSTIVAQDIARATNAPTVTVIVREAPRGGISIEATASISQTGQQSVG